MPDIPRWLMAMTALEGGATVYHSNVPGRRFEAMAPVPESTRVCIKWGDTPIAALDTAARAAGLNPSDYPATAALLRLVEEVEAALRRLEAIAKHYPVANDGVTELVAFDLRQALAAVVKGDDAGS